MVIGLVAEGRERNGWSQDIFRKLNKLLGSEGEGGGRKKMGNGL